MGHKSLLVAGIAATCTLGAALWAAEEPKPGHRAGHEEWLKEQVGLSDAQIEQLKELRVQERKAAIKRHADQRVVRLELLELLKADSVDEQAVRAKAKQLATLEATNVTARAESGLALRKIVSGEQAEKLLRRMGRERRHHRWDGDGAAPAGRRGPGRGHRPGGESEGSRPDGGAADGRFGDPSVAGEPGAEGLGQL